MDHLLLCVNHPEKIAKRHCKKCDQNICNECVFDSHIEHNKEIEKIDYSIDIKQAKISQILGKDIESIINKNLNDLKPIIYKLVLEKTEQYVKDHKNLQLKLITPKCKKPVNTTTNPKPETVKQENKNNDNSQKQDVPAKKNINLRAKMFEGQNKREPQKTYDENNPIKKNVDKEKNILARAKLFAQKK